MLEPNHTDNFIKCKQPKDFNLKAEIRKWNFLKLTLNIKIQTD